MALGEAFATNSLITSAATGVAEDNKSTKKAGRTFFTHSSYSPFRNPVNILI
jgi:hypothetical protein